MTMTNHDDNNSKKRATPETALQCSGHVSIYFLNDNVNIVLRFILFHYYFDNKNQDSMSFQPFKYEDVELWMSLSSSRVKGEGVVDEESLVDNVTNRQ